MNQDQLENPVLGYVVLAAALLVGMLSATVLGQSPGTTPQKSRGPDIPRLADNRGETDCPSVSADPAKKCFPDETTAAKREIAKNREATNREIGRRWILGVRSTATSTGCVIESVVIGSAAERAGLRIGDRILTIDGKQVGWREGKLAALHRAIDGVPTRSCHMLVERAGSGIIGSMRVSLHTLAESLGQ